MPHILMVVTSNAALPGGGPTGLWLEELAASYYVFADAGCVVEMGSPAGGAAPIDPLSLQEPWLTAAGRRLLEDSVVTASLRKTRRLDSIDALTFDAIYLVGGAATAWDYPADADLANIVTTLFINGRPVAGVCHGVLGLAGARDASGKPIVAGRKVTGISNAEETLTGFDKIVPILPETRLRELGGLFQCAAPLESHVVADSNVLTGQNPASAGALAQAVLRQLN